MNDHDATVPAWMPRRFRDQADRAAYLEARRAFIVDQLARNEAILREYEAILRDHAMEPRTPSPIRH